MSKLRVVQEKLTEKHLKNAERSAAQGLLQYRQQHRVVFWVLMGIAIAAHMLLSATIVPFLLVFHSFFFDAIALLTALLFGMMYVFIISNVLHLERRHHVLAGIIVPLGAAITVFVLGNRLNEDVSILYALIYGLAFVLPYAVHKAVAL